METTSLLAMVLALLIGAVVGALVARSKGETEVVRARAERDAAVLRAEQLVGDREALTHQFKVMSDEALAAQEERNRATLLTPVADGLAALNQQLNQVEQQRAAASAQLREQVRMVMSTGEDLRRETNALSTALRKPQVRGAWGELQLRRVVEIAGMVEHCDFYEQASDQTSADVRIRPDLKVMLGDQKFVYVDAKVPLSAFLDAQQTTDADAQQRLLGQFAENVKTHVDQLSAKQYWKADTHSPEFVVLFIPSETLAAEALAQRPDLHEYASARNIIIATPTTLIGLLRAVAYGWRQAALADSAAQVFELGRELYDRLATMGGAFNKLGRSLQASVNHYNSTVASLEARVLVTARRFRDLKVTDAELQPSLGVEQSPRQLTAPELLAAAEWELVAPDQPSVAELVEDDHAAATATLVWDAHPRLGS